MWKLICAVLASVLIACLSLPAMAAPPPPQLSYSVDGLRVTVSWSTVPGATGYTLYYAPYPFVGVQSIGSFDMGGQMSLSVNLWEGAAFYIATTSRDESGESGYSNIEYFVAKLPALQNWTDEAPMGSARKNFAGGVINRKIIVFGGESTAGKALATTEIYDPGAGQWSAGAANSAAGQGVSNLSSAVLNDRLYVFGASDSTCAPTNFVQEYTLEDNQWRALTAKPAAVNGAPAVAYNGEIYLFGGWSGNCAERTLRREVEAFNPSAGSWRRVATLPEMAKEDAAVAVYEGKAYLFGGSDAAGSLSRQIIAYDFGTQQWTTSGLGELTAPRSFPTSSPAPVVDGNIVLAGGLESGNPVARSEGLQESRKVEFFDPRTHSVEVGEPLPVATAGHLAVVLDDQLFVIGGSADQQPTDRSMNVAIDTRGEGSTTYLGTDADGDGFTENQGDCNDNDAGVNPAASDLCGDGIDQDCNGTDLECANRYVDFLQYRVMGNGSEYYQAYVFFTQIDPSQITAVELQNPSGQVLPAQTPFNYELDETPLFLLYDSASGIFQPTQLAYEGVYLRFSKDLSLLPGAYTVHVRTLQGGEIVRTINYGGRVVLPVVPAQSLYMVKNQDGSLTFSWAPSALAGQSVVRVNIFDQDFNGRLFVSLPPGAGSVTIPANYVNQALNQGQVSGLYWRVENRHYDGNHMNDSRSITSSPLVPWP